MLSGYRYRGMVTKRITNGLGNLDNELGGLFDFLLIS